MPRLLYFIPCNKAITDAADQTITLVSVLDGLQVQTPANGQPFAPDAVIPIRWSAVSFWLKEPRDERKQFEQQLIIVMPDGTENVDGVVKFEMATRVYRQTINLNAFPIGQAGEYRLRLSIRDISEGNKWTILTEYPVVIEHVRGQSG